MEPPITLKDRLFELRERFVRTMPDRIAEIASTLSGCIDGSKELTERLEGRFHALAGTAGTYNLNAVAAVALEGEEACAELKQSPLDSENVAYLMFLVEQLRGALAVDAPSQRTAHTVLIAADPRDAASEQPGVSTA